MDGRRATVVLPNDPDLVDILAKNGVDISVRHSTYFVAISHQRSLKALGCKYQTADLLNAIHITIHSPHAAVEHLHACALYVNLVERACYYV